MDSKKGEDMKGVKPIEMEQKAAQEAWKEYRDATIKGGFVKEYYELKNLYRQLAKGRKIIDIRECIKQAGLNLKNEPRLAIASLGYDKEIRVQRRMRAGQFAIMDFISSGRHWDKFSRIRFAPPYLPEWKMPLTDQEKTLYDLPELTARIPIVPPRFMPKVKDLRPYFVLWEVKDWHAKPKDPFLLKKIGENSFVVLGAWDLTPLERMFL